MHCGVWCTRSSPDLGLLTRRSLSLHPTPTTRDQAAQTHRHPVHHLCTQAVNYWDSVISVLPAKEDGSLDPVSCVLPPPTPVRARGLDDHLRDRQSEPHARADEGSLRQPRKPRKPRKLQSWARLSRAFRTASGARTLLPRSHAARAAH